MSKLIVCHAARLVGSKATGPKEEIAGAVKTIPFALKTPEHLQTLCVLVEKSAVLTRATGIQVLWDDSMSRSFIDAMIAVAGKLKIPFEKRNIPHMPAFANHGAISCVEPKVIDLVENQYPTDTMLWHVTLPGSGAMALDSTMTAYVRAMVAEMRQVGAMSMLMVKNQLPIVNASPDNGEHDEIIALDRRRRTAFKSFKLLHASLDGAETRFGFICKARKTLTLHSLPTTLAVV